MHVTNEPSATTPKKRTRPTQAKQPHEPTTFNKKTTPKQTTKTPQAKQLYEPIELSKSTKSKIKPLHMISLSVAGAFITSAVCLWGMGSYVASIPKVLSGAGNTVITQVKTPLAMSTATPYDGQTSFAAWEDAHADTVSNVKVLDSKLDQAVTANEGYVDEATMAVVTDAKNAAAAAIPTGGEFVSDQHSIEALDNAYRQLDEALNTVTVQSGEARAAEQARIEREQKLSVLTSGIDASDWSDEKIAFVAEWGPRVDAYLSGRPACGYGEYFAAAAYDYDVDPRIGAAISVIESGGFAQCFKPYNGWGWGSSSWGSMEEAIDGWTAAFHRGYGYDMDYADCRAYCPPNAGYYDKLRGQMEQI